MLDGGGLVVTDDGEEAWAQARRRERSED